MGPETSEEFAEWVDDRYETGIDRFDEQHRRLFDLLNDLYEEMNSGDSDDAVGEALRELEAYTEYHFGDEEEFMQDCGYAMDCADCFYDHRKAHKEFAETVRELREKHENGEYITMEVLTFVRDWLDTHIAARREDQNYSEYYTAEVDDDYEYEPGTLRQGRADADRTGSTGVTTGAPSAEDEPTTTVSVGDERRSGVDLSVPAESMGEWVAGLADATPDERAVRATTADAAAPLTFRALYEEAEAVAGGLMREGFHPGDRLAVQVGARPEWAVVDLACHLAGLVSVPLTPGIEGRAVRVVQQADVDGLVAEPETPVAVEEAAGTVVGVESLPRATPSSLPGLDRDPDQPATVVSDVGADAEPMGCVLTDGNLRAAVASLSEALPLGPGRTGTCFLPPSSVYQRVAAYYLWETGGTVAFLDREDLEAELAALGPDVVVGVPAVYRRLHDRMRERFGELGRVKRRLADGVAERRGAALLADPTADSLVEATVDRLVFSTLRSAVGLDDLEYALCGHGRLEADVIEYLRGCGVAVSELYGPPELAGVGTMNHARSYRPGTVGTPLPGVEVALSADGEVLFRGPTVMDGYLGASDAESVAVHDGWFHTGRVGAFDAAGGLELGRE